MLMNRNFTPSASNFNKTQIEEAFVTEKETEGLVEDITEIITDSDKYINENIGFNHMEKTDEMIAEVGDSHFVRRSNFSDGEIFHDRSLREGKIDGESIIDYSRHNDTIAVITTGEGFNTGDIRIPGIDGKLRGTVKYGMNTQVDDSVSFNPNVESGLNDIISTYFVDETIFNVHRGGYVSEYNVKSRGTSIYKVIEEDIHAQVDNHDNHFFYSRYQSVGVSAFSKFDGRYIVIVTPVEIYVFDTSSGSVRKLGSSFVDTYTIIDIEVVDSVIYNLCIVDNTNPNTTENCLIYEYDISSNSTNIINLDADSEFTPNTLVHIGDSIVAYNKLGRLTVDGMNQFIKYQMFDIKTKVVTSESYDIKFPVGIQFIDGLSEGGLHIGLNSDNPVLRNSTICKNPTGYTLSKHSIGSGVETLIYGNFSLMVDDMVITASSTDINFSTYNGWRVNKSVTFKPSEFRNASTAITTIADSGGSLIVTYNDNTFDMIAYSDIKSLIDSGKTTIRDFGAIHFKSFDDNFYLLNDKFYRMTKDDPSSMVWKSYGNPLYSESEWNSKVAVKVDMNEIDDFDILVVTNLNGNFRTAVFNLHVGEGL